MNLVRKILGGATPGVAVADNASELAAFLQPDRAAAVWQRQTPHHVQVWLDALDPHVLPAGRVVVQPSAVPDNVRHICDLAGMPGGPERSWLEEDIAFLAKTFSSLMQARYVRLRLDVVNTNACRKFHVDAIRARLVCTYRGTGTQYGISSGGADPKHVSTVQAGSPILLRGSLWPPVPPCGLLHRSPPIEGTGETRLVLVLDPVSDPEDEA